MDHIWAAERGWPSSMNLPSDSSKGVYLLEAYHYLHCLVCHALIAFRCKHHANASNAVQNILRETLWEAVEQKLYIYPPDSRVEYCFDTLRQVFIRPFFHLSPWTILTLTLVQYIQCNADSTPLYTFGGFTAGTGQLHRCKNWNQLRDFATRHTACVAGSGRFCDNTGVVDLEKDFG